MLRLFDRHKARSTFYHFVALAMLLSTALWALGLISTRWNMFIGWLLFFTDYLAEMYDPNPESPGPWFKAHFHRFLGPDDAPCGAGQADCDSCIKADKMA